MSAILPARYYSRDPADIVADDQIHKLGCRACDHCVQSLSRWWCSNDRAIKFHKQVPNVGPNCKYFDLKG